MSTVTLNVSQITVSIDWRYLLSCSRQVPGEGWKKVPVHICLRRILKPTARKQCHEHVSGIVTSDFFQSSANHECYMTFTVAHASHPKRFLEGQHKQAGVTWHPAPPGVHQERGWGKPENQLLFLAWRSMVCPRNLGSLQQASFGVVNRVMSPGICSCEVP